MLRRESKSIVLNYAKYVKSLRLVKRESTISRMVDGDKKNLSSTAIFNGKCITQYSNCIYEITDSGLSLAYTIPKFTESEMTLIAKKHHPSANITSIVMSFVDSGLCVFENEIYVIASIRYDHDDNRNSKIFALCHYNINDNTLSYVYSDTISASTSDSIYYTYGTTKAVSQDKILMVIREAYLRGESKSSRFIIVDMASKNAQLLDEFKPISGPSVNVIKIQDEWHIIYYSSDSIYKAYKLSSLTDTSPIITDITSDDMIKITHSVQVGSRAFGYCNRVISLMYAHNSLDDTISINNTDLGETCDNIFEYSDNTFLVYSSNLDHLIPVDIVEVDE